MAAGAVLQNGSLCVPLPERNSTFMNAFDFEVYDIPYTLTMMTKYRYIMISSIVLYLVGIFAGQAWMANRPAYSLRRAMTVWNTGLALFSIAGFLRTIPELFNLMRHENGFYNSLCTCEMHNYATSFWALTFTISKIIEFGDTAFIVLRKQKLIFLHWYHHITVLLLVWIYFEHYEPSFRWFGTMNYFVHACMYSYYALKALQIKVPRSCAMVLTIMQIVQMIVGLYINVYTYWVKSSGTSCARSMGNIYFGLAIYGSYFVLFLNFFRKAYFAKPSKLKQK